MHTIVVRMRNYQTLTGGTIYMVSFPFKIFTSVWFTCCFSNSFLFIDTFFLVSVHLFIVLKLLVHPKAGH